METLVKILEKTPEMAALIFVVWMFLKHQSETRTEFITTIRSINAEELEARRLSREVITENTKTGVELTAAVRALEITIGKQCK